MANTVYVDYVRDDPIFHLNVNRIVEFCEIIRDNDSQALRAFHAENPNIGMNDVVLVPCCDMCPAKVIESGKNTFASHTMQPEFVDTLFECGYVSKNDVLMFHEALNSSSTYEAWDGIYRFFEKLDPEAVRKTVIRYDEGATRNTLDALRCCIISMYYGKVHPIARAIYEKLVAYGCEHIDNNRRQQFVEFMIPDIAYQEQHNPHFQTFKYTQEYQAWLAL